VDLSKASFEELIEETLRRLDEDPERPGLKKTPHRVAASLRWLTRGCCLDAEKLVRDAMFEEPHESMVLVRDIELYSMCEHHMLPFFGKAHVAYLPNGRIVGLSKIARLVDIFARRLQVQERLTDQVADALYSTLEPLGVGVVVEAYHLCMMMRGVEKQHSEAVTSSMLGCFRDSNETRSEFLSLIRQRSNGI